MYGQAAHFAEVSPQHVQRPAADHVPLQLRDPEVADILVEGDELLGEELASGAGVYVDEGLDRRDVRCAGTAHDEAHGLLLCQAAVGMAVGWAVGSGCRAFKTT